MMKKILLVLGLFTHGTINAQICYKENIIETSPSEQWIDNKDGTVTDAKTGLEWVKCSIGQTYNSANGGCEGIPKNFSSWSEALMFVQKSNESTNGILGKHDFRVPNIKELSSILELSCMEPAINLDIFPSTPNNSYISSTPSDSRINESEFRYLNFENGAEFTPEVSFVTNLRVVRN
jgi:hypothetical protein